MDATRKARRRVAAAQTPLDALLSEIRACRICRDRPRGAPLPHDPRPVLRATGTARLCIVSQAPGTRVHASGVSFTDPSGVRLRGWMGVTEDEFYDETRVAIVPMGFCFPGLSPDGADLPPRPECAPRWRRPLFDLLPNLSLILLVGIYGHRWHVGDEAKLGMTRTVADWRRHLAAPRRPRLLPLPHPSWRNNAWLKRNPWFDGELLPVLRQEVRALLGQA